MKCDCDVELNEGHVVENFTKCHILMTMIQDHLIDDNAMTCAYPELKQLAIEASEKIMEIYQETSRIDLEAFPD